MSPFTDWLVHPGNEGVANGDGYLTYVGPDGIPLPSIRLENFRDGLEDYAYAKILERMLKERETGNRERRIGRAAPMTRSPSPIPLWTR